MFIRVGTLGIYGMETWLFCFFFVVWYVMVIISSPLCFYGHWTICVILSTYLS